MKKLMMVLLILIGMSANAQWNYYCDFYQGFNNVFGPGYFNDVAFSSQDTGMYSFTVQHGSHNYTDSLQLTTNGANSWNAVFQNYGGVNIYYSPPNTFFYISLDFNLDDVIYKTIDFGTNWTAINGPWDYITEFSTPDSSTFFLIKDLGLQIVPSLYRGINNSWTFIDSFYTYKAGSMCFLDSTNGFLAVSDSLGSYTCHSIIKTLTGGTSWTNSFHDSSFNINKLFFLSVSKGFAVGDSGKVVKTLDSGSTWQYINTNYSNSLNDVLFFDDTLGYVVGNTGLILKTIDGGSSWQQEILTPPDTGNVIKIMNAPPGSIYALINDIYNYPELYISYPHSGVGIPQISPQPSISLFPNPFSTTATLSIRNYELGIRSGEVQIINLLGQDVKTIPIINQNEITINRDNLAEGMYFYKIINQNKETVAVGKMVIE